jgi:hypothetical protein
MADAIDVTAVTSAGSTKDSTPLAICVAKINFSLQNIGTERRLRGRDRPTKYCGLTRAIIRNNRILFLRHHAFPSFFRKIPFRSRPRGDGGCVIRVNFKRAKNFDNAPLHEDHGKALIAGPEDVLVLINLV